jgi:hypothetical protein
MVGIEVHLVRVTTDDGVRQLWLAAAPRGEAVDRVLDTIPEGWAAMLVHRRLGADIVAALDIKPGEVRQYQTS